MMSELSRYVDGLFAKYAKSRANEELKAEILSNLEAKAADLRAAGLSTEEALGKAEESITGVDALIDGNRRVYLMRMKLEQAQRSLIVILVGWIITIPLLIFRIGVAANGLFFVAVLIAGLYYLVLSHRMENASGAAQTGYVNARETGRRAKTVWLLWALFAAVSVLANTALYFGSNLWFSRKVTINGPYALASLLAAYFVPLLTAVIPVIFSIPVRLIAKYEVKDDDEA